MLHLAACIFNSGSVVRMFSGLCCAPASSFFLRQPAPSCPFVSSSSVDSKKEASSPLKQNAKSASSSPAHRTTHHKQADPGGTQESLSPLSPHHDRQPPSNGLLTKAEKEQEQEIRRQRSDGMVNGDAREEEREVAEDDGVSERALPPDTVKTPAERLDGKEDGEQRNGEGGADLKVRCKKPFCCYSHCCFSSG